MDPIRIPAGAGTTLSLPGTEITVKAGGAESGGAFSLAEARTPRGGAGPIPHLHTDREETFFVIEGAVDFDCDGRLIRAEPHDVLIVPRGVVHSFVNASDSDLRMLILHTPSGMERYFRELHGLLASGPPDPDALVALMRRHGMELPHP